jgi:EpsI family protein
MSDHSGIEQTKQSPRSYSVVLSKELWAKIGLLVAVFFLAYYVAILSLVRIWSARDDYSHGFLIPFISLYFVWHKRTELRQIPVKPSIIAGTFITILGGMMLFAGYIGGVVTVQQISILVVIPGIVLSLFGTDYLKALALPIGYLIFMIPPALDPVISNIHWPFQLFSAAVSAKLLGILGIPVLRHAQYLDLPNITLEVANVCSGVRYLISIIAVSIPIALFIQTRNIIRILFIASAVVIGILINPLRITLIGVWSYYTGAEDVHGPAHMLKGLFVSQIGFVLLFVLAWVLTRIQWCKSDRPLDAADKSGVNLTINTKKFNMAWLIATILFIGLGGLVFLYQPKAVPLKAPLSNIPLTMGEWQGADVVKSPGPLDIKGADSEITRVYKHPSGKEIVLYLAYFEFQKQGKEFVRDSLHNLYDNSKELEISSSYHDSVRINRVVQNDSATDSVVLYWYDINGRIIADRFKAKFATTLDGIFHRRSNGAIVIVTGKGNKADYAGDAPDDETGFVRVLMPALDRILP